MVNDGSRRSHDFKDELRGKPEWFGVYASERLSLICSWKGLAGKVKVKTGIGKSDLPGLQGGPRKRDFVSHDKVRAPRLYPDRDRLSGADPKPIQAAAVKSRGGERWRKSAGINPCR